MTRAEAVRKANEVAAEIAAEYGVEASWRGEVVEIRGHGLSGQLRLTSDHLHLEVQLGFLLALVRDSIVSAIEAKLDDLLRTEAPAKPERKRPRRKAGVAKIDGSAARLPKSKKTRRRHRLDRKPK